MTRKTLFLTALVVTVVLPALAFAGPAERGEGLGLIDGPGRDGARFARHFLPPPGYLELSDEQLAAAEVIADGIRDQLGAQRDEHRALRDELRAALDSETPDPAAVGRLVIDLHSDRGRIRAVLEQADQDFSAILTAEQLVKWENFKELRRERGPRGEGGRRGPHGPRGDRGFGPGPGPIDSGFDG